MPAINRLGSRIALVLILASVSCQTLRFEDNTQEDSSTLSYPYGPYYGKQPNTSPLNSAFTPLLKPEDLESVVVEEESLSEEGFCKDDIYTTFLKDLYLKQKQDAQEKTQTPPTGKSSRKLAELIAKQEAEALNFAAARLAPEVSAYFGDIPVVVRPEIEQWMRYFKSAGRFEFALWIARSQAMAPVLRPILKKEGLPAEVIYLAMIESGFNNNAYSPAHAAGPWQLVAGTARLYGLTINRWQDERKDPIKSTQAAARYLRALHRQFGDWYLALAAYNTGSMRIEKAIARTQSKSFWDLCKGNHLKKETKQFVPKILAALILGASPREHGFNIHKNSIEKFPGTTVQVDKPISLNQLAKLLGVPVQQIKRWNPELLHDITPPPQEGKNKTYSLRLAENHLDRYEQIKDQLTKASLPKIAPKQKKLASKKRAVSKKLVSLR